MQSVAKPDFQTEDILEVYNSYFTSFQIELANFISYYYTCKKGVSFDLFEPCQKSELLQKNNFEKLPNLTQKQQDAMQFCLQNQNSLIFGDTGSGKSEIYISLIAKFLNEGKQALFLMPEISLTPQMTKRLKMYFGDSLGVWHSKISKTEKKEILEKLKNSEIKIIAGARSALFLPYEHLGIIIVDEEHDDSYKQEQNPRYNARDLALFIGTKQNIKVVLGSATPSLTTFKKIPHFRLKGTFFKSEKEIIFENNENQISQNILQNIKTSLENKKQCIIFLPIRANFKYLICKNCNNIIKCPYCSVSLSLHKEKNALICHYCGYTTFANNPCQICGEKITEAKKIGTSEVVEILKKEFPTARIAKFDKDEITTQKKLENLLKKFNDFEIDILVGTQMLSKGHDYHNVDLAVILGLDEHLNYADFKAREKTIALAMQVAGRAGRAGKAKVIIQTLQEEFFKEYIQNYDKFLEDEDYFRENFYPPYTRLLRILISHKNEKIAQNSMKECVLKLKSLNEIEIIGYGKSVIEIISSKYRYEILIRAKSHIPLIKASRICAKIKHTQIDMDPINFS